MPLLSNPAGKTPRPRKAAARALPPIALVDNTIEFRLADTLVTALPDGALWVAESKTLIVSDVHFEKGASFARRGQMLPPYDTHQRC